MWRRARSMARKVVVSLLTLATLLVYAAPSHAGPLSHHQTSAAQEQILDDAHGDAVAAIPVHERQLGSCEDLGLLDDGVCCSVSRCAAMPSGILAVEIGGRVPRAETSKHQWPILAIPDGIGGAPAFRPPV